MSRSFKHDCVGQTVWDNGTLPLSCIEATMALTELKCFSLPMFHDGFSLHCFPHLCQWLTGFISYLHRHDQKLVFVYCVLISC